MYKQGFGERKKIEKTFEPIETNIKENELIFPLEVLPLNLQTYILSCNQTLNNSIDYMGCSLLFLTSIILGNSSSLNPGVYTGAMR